jgi:hypothetical protein
MPALNDPRPDTPDFLEDFNPPQHTRITRETLMGLRNMRMPPEHVDQKHGRRTSPQTAQTSPKPPVSAWKSAVGGTAALLGLGNAPSFLAIGDGPSSLSIAKDQEGPWRPATRRLALGASPLKNARHDPDDR